MNDREYLQQQTKGQLIIFLNNADLTIEDLRRRMRKLTGCGDFGNLDGMNGSCIECQHKDPELFDKCWDFTLENDNE